MPSLQAVAVGLALLAAGIPARAAERQVPPGTFKDLDDEIACQALLLHGKQLFLDDHVIEELKGARKVLNRPVKHPRNPLLVRDKSWEGFAVTYGSVVHDPHDGLYKLWYQIARGDVKDEEGVLGYATSRDGVAWDKPALRKDGSNVVTFAPKEPWVVGAGVLIDPAAADPKRRFKMLYSARPDGKARSLCSGAAYSPDGIHWTPEPGNPLIPFSDTQICPYWDGRLGRYVAYLRFGPPNTRIISRVESEDFVHWSPKVTVLRPGKLDAPFLTQFYLMTVLPYEGIYLGLVCAYHGETIRPIPADQLWMDRKNLQLVFSRNGVTWQRVGPEGAIPAGELRRDRDWKRVAERAVFLPNGDDRKDWDWGVIHPVQGSLVVGDEIRIYYQAQGGRNWWNYHGDANKDGYGLATLRLDGFVSVEAEAGTLTTRPLVFFGDTLVVNANAAGGSVVVEALDAAGRPVPGFGSGDCVPITTDGVRHVVAWKGKSDCHLLQARPIKLRFHLHRAKLYSFEPRIRHKHYLQSYD